MGCFCSKNQDDHDDRLDQPLIVSQDRTKVSEDKPKSCCSGKVSSDCTKDKKQGIEKVESLSKSDVNQQFEKSIEETEPPVSTASSAQSTEPKSSPDSNTTSGKKKKKRNKNKRRKSKTKSTTAQ